MMKSRAGLHEVDSVMRKYSCGTEEPDLWVPVVHLLFALVLPEAGDLSAPPGLCPSVLLLLLLHLLHQTNLTANQVTFGSISVTQPLMFNVRM